MDFKLLQKVKVVSTDHLDETLLEIMKTENYRRPLFVMDHFLAQVEIVQDVQTELQANGIEYAVFDKVVSDPPTSVVDAGVAAFKEHKADSIIAIGGGSSIDVARGINIVRVNGGKISDYVDPQVTIKPCPGLIAVPTTSGTGSEMSNALVVTDETSKQKLAILADDAVSEYAVLNPDLLLSLPKNMTIATGLDAFSHAAEGYLSKLASPVTDAICEKVMFLLYNYLPRAVKNGNDREARERVMVAATLAGWMLNNAGTNVGHSMAHVLGSKYHIVHGEAVAYALPGVLRFVGPVMPHKVREIGQILGAVYPENAPEEQTTLIAERTYKDFRDQILGLHPFSDYKISHEELATNAEAVAYERFAGNTPREVTVDAVETLLASYGKQ
ncbi:MAG: iron-containing alcohol dehydrogenase [Furfurilactobacillus sp.]|jgi:alcohol dehydrogenase|uniref:iron-containing alcohol dehydrogenase n=1 Tax=Furfurilactobacillus TaxID=2767882 RepID=UPI001F4051C4|nr:MULTISPECIES: iron-containing alcohol dehydrogenase [Furfurilactobacillus]MCF6418664.1 iron-containing alcohol dehydrogenase [Furfurilactobacillus milii]MCH4012125.1 iron-containing alcohol dehydrogenase [Furfurilactobacillus sp.]MCH4038017.1 iron-containing alcohol dehydrogenase [Furfurilactobacillus sp.]MCH4115346.1 iron-containing alcohol dehydrogenase [Furfurilactobacillus sp.]MCI1340567.1 iron-containing alcohol dehydrogenase [Furfurilactobacillus sp.]